MSTVELIVNVVLSASVVTAMVGFLAWSITRGRGTGVERLRTRVPRAAVSSADELAGNHYAADQRLAVG